MKLWVTGSRGFIGRHVVDHALAAGHEVTALTRPGAGGLRSSVRVLELDLRDPDAVAAEVKASPPDAIVHLAWYARPEDYLASLDNVESLATTLAFAKAALLAGCRNMVGVGTCLEYAGLPHARAESDPLRPRSIYARCKHAADLVLEELFDRQGARLAWARLFHMHGPGENPKRLIPAAAAALRGGRPFALSPGEQVRDHLDVRDVAAALVHLAASNLNGAVNVCSGVPVTLRQVLEAVGAAVGRGDLLHFGERPYLAGEIMNLSGNPARLFESGFRLAHADLATSIRQGIAAPGTTI